jgi:hypothetical protein
MVYSFSSGRIHEFKEYAWQKWRLTWSTQCLLVVGDEGQQRLRSVGARGFRILLAR